MPLVVLGSLFGAPGVTSTAIGVAAGFPVERPVLLMEATSDGGVLAARYEPLRAARTLADVAVAVRREFAMSAVWDEAQELWGVPVVVAPPSADQVATALEGAGATLAAGLAADPTLTVVDVGRLSRRSLALPLAQAASATVLVVRPDFEQALALPSRVEELREAGVDPWLVTLGSKPESPDRLAGEAEVSLFAVVPDDPGTADRMARMAVLDRRVTRSVLWRTFREMASILAEYATPSAPAMPPPPPMSITEFSPSPNGEKPGSVVEGGR